MSNAKQWKVSANGEEQIVEGDKAMQVAEEMFQKHGVQPKVEPLADTVRAPANDVAPRAKPLPIAAPATSESKAAPVYSDFGKGNQIVDEKAKARIEAQHASLKASGVAVDASKQLYATGTRMARVGYDNQQRRADEHHARMLFSEAAEKLSTRVQNEKREDVEVSAAEFGRAVQANGKVSAFGLRVTEQAMRGLCARLESPALRYILGLRDRVAAAKGELDAIEANPEKSADDAARADFLFQVMRADRAKIADILKHECARNPDVALKLRTRQGVGDIFATTSPSFTAADAPEVVKQVLNAKKLPKDARGSFAYDPISTAWELRWYVFTPTPVQQQCVGEPFEGHGSLQARDNGTSKLRGGGGGSFLACLNAGTYTVEDEGASRMHRTNILVDFDSMLAAVTKSTDAYVAAWGANREHEVEVPTGLKINDVIPGFWRYLLTDRRSELAGVLPGRSEHHVERLTQAFWDERRDEHRVVRSDFAQGWTKYIQKQPTPIRRDAEAAIGDWLVSNKRVGLTMRDDA